MIKKEKFDSELQNISRFAKAISHPARLAILQYLAETKTCISGDISDYLPLSRSTVSQHLNDLKELVLIHGEIDGLKVNYCLYDSTISKYKSMFVEFYKDINTKYPNRVNVVFVNIMLPQNQRLMKYYGIAAIPTQVLLNKEAKEFFRHTGYYSVDELIKSLTIN